MSAALTPDIEIGGVEAFEAAAIHRLGEWTCPTKALVYMARKYDVGFSPRAAVRRLIRKLRKAGKLTLPYRTMNLGTIWSLDLRS
jgi:hypothetical protein